MAQYDIIVSYSRTILVDAESEAEAKDKAKEQFVMQAPEMQEVKASVSGALKKTPKEDGDGNIDIAESLAKAKQAVKNDEPQTPPQPVETPKVELPKREGLTTVIGSGAKPKPPGSGLTNTINTLTSENVYRDKNGERKEDLE
jgi:hypothetical protein